jgi:hypothetical protein
MLKVLLWVLMNAPSLVSLFEAFLKLIASFPKEQRETAIKELSDAHREKNPAKIESVMRRVTSIPDSARLVTEF